MASIEFDPADYIDELEDYELLDEVKERGLNCDLDNKQITTLYNLFISDKQKFEDAIKELFYSQLGRIVS